MNTADWGVRTKYELLPEWNPLDCREASSMAYDVAFCRLLCQCQLSHGIKERYRSLNATHKRSAGTIDMYLSIRTFASPHKFARISVKGHVRSGVATHCFRDAIPFGNNGSYRLGSCQTFRWRTGCLLARGLDAAERLLCA